MSYVSLLQAFYFGIHTNTYLSDLSQGFAVAQIRVAETVENNVTTAISAALQALANLHECTTTDRVGLICKCIDPLSGPSLTGSKHTTWVHLVASTKSKPSLPLSTSAPSRAKHPNHSYTMSRPPHWRTTRITPICPRPSPTQVPATTL